MEKNLSRIILRFSLGLVFLYFGINQVINPDNWVGYIPGFLNGVIITANNLVMINGLMEIILGIFMILGLYLRFSSLALGIHLLFISFSLGFTPIGVRDFGLAMVTLVVFLDGIDKYCLDWKFNKKKSNQKKKEEIIVEDDEEDEDFANEE